MEECHTVQHGPPLDHATHIQKILTDTWKILLGNTNLSQLFLLLTQPTYTFFIHETDRSLT